MVTSAAPGIFVAIDQYDPDWVATVDGTPAAIHRVNYLMRGVALPAGVHRLRFVYAPRALAAGIQISLASAIVALLLAGWGAWRTAEARRASAGGPAEAADPTPGTSS